MADSPPLGDDDLLERLRAGDEEAFALLYRRRQGAIYRFALRMSGSASLAEDVTQDVFMALIREPFGYDPQRGSLPAYLYGIARNQVRRRLERERIYVAMDDEEGPGPEDAPGSDPLADLTRRERIEEVREAVLALPPHYREVVVLCELQRLSYDEAARVVGCAVGTIRSRLHRGRELLTARLRRAQAPGWALPSNTRPVGSVG